MTFSFQASAVGLLSGCGIAVSCLACGANPSSTAQLPEQSTTFRAADTASLPALADDGATVCQINESAVAQSGQYSSDVALTASVALLGDTGVDVVMTPKGAIAAVNTATGAILYWVDPATGEIAHQQTLPSPVSDIAFDGDGTLAIALPDQLLRLSIATGETMGELPLSGISRVAIAPDGYVGAIAEKALHLYDSSNRLLFKKEKDTVGVTDVEVISCDNAQLVYLTSFRNATFTDLNSQRNPVQIAHLEAFDFSGERQWSLFGDSAETIKQNVADTRLLRVTLGRDGYLYIGGESAGTATIFRWRGQPMTAEEQHGSARPFVARIDQHSQLHNSGAAHLPYYGRVHPIDGELLRSQMTFPRRSDTKANAMRLGDIAGGANGNLYLGGAASASIANRDDLTLNGQSVGGYAGSDRTWLATTPDFEARRFWTVLAETPGKGMVKGVDAGYGYAAALSDVESGTVPVTTGSAEGTVFLSFTSD